MKVIAEGDMEFCIRGFNNVMDCTGCEGCGEIEAITREEFEKRQRFMFGNDSHLPPIILE